MNWTFHFLIGFILALVVFYFLSANPYEILFLALFAGGSALLPDLDHGNSKAKKILDIVIIFIAVIFTFLFNCAGSFSCILTENFALRVFAFVGIYSIIFTFFKPEHRGITHSIIAAAFFALLVYFILGMNFALAGAAGYLSHLLADREIKII